MRAQAGAQERERLQQVEQQQREWEQAVHAAVQPTAGGKRRVRESPATRAPGSDRRPDHAADRQGAHAVKRLKQGGGGAAVAAVARAPDSAASAAGAAVPEAAGMMVPEAMGAHHARPRAGMHEAAAAVQAAAQTAVDAIQEVARNVIDAVRQAALVALRELEVARNAVPIHLLQVFIGMQDWEDNKAFEDDCVACSRSRRRRA